MPRVLLVDDSALVRNSMQAALEPLGLEIVHAENGAVAVEKASFGVWDLIFLDVVMPVMDGPTALREIRGRGIKTPVVLVTSVSTTAVVAGAVRLGDVHYVGKPFTPPQIAAVATKLLALDPHAASAPPRVLVQCADPEVARRLGKALPPAPSSARTSWSSRVRTTSTRWRRWHRCFARRSRRPRSSRPRRSATRQRPGLLAVPSMAYCPW